MGKCNWPSVVEVCRCPCRQTPLTSMFTELPPSAVFVSSCWSCWSACMGAVRGYTPVRRICFPRNRRQLASYGVFSPGPPHSDITALAFHPDGRHLVIGTANGTVALWTIGATTPDKTFPCPPIGSPVWPFPRTETYWPRHR